MNFCVTRVATAAAILLAFTGHDLGGFAHGFVHPIGGLDHVLAMVAVGLYAALRGGRVLWLLPATFVGVLAVGGALGAAGVGLPHVETLIALSVVILGLALALRLGIPTLAAIALVGLFAIFHGHAHGAEMPDVSAYAYAAGFMLATALLQGAGILAGLLAGRIGESGWRVVQAAGGATAVADAAIPDAAA
jgi:urease accessory protein